MILTKEEYYNFMRAFREKAVEAGIREGAINRIIASVPEAEEYDLNLLYRGMVTKANELGVDHDLFTTVLAEATKDREKELEKSGELSSRQVVYGTPQFEELVSERYTERQVVYGTAQPDSGVGEYTERQVVYGPAQPDSGVGEYTERQVVYGPAQPDRVYVEHFTERQAVYGTAQIEPDIVSEELVDRSVVYGPPQTGRGKR